MNHLSRFEIVNLSVFIVPTRVRNIDLDAVNRDMLKMLGLEEWPRGRIKANAFTTYDLEQKLAGEIGVIVYLGQRRRDQNSALAVKSPERGDVLLQLREDRIKDSVVALIDLVRPKQVQPKAAPRDGFEYLVTRQAGQIAFSPKSALGALRSHVDEHVVLPRIILDEFRERIGTKQVYIVKAVPDANGLVVP